MLNWCQHDTNGATRCARTSNLKNIFGLIVSRKIDADNLILVKG